MNKEFNVNKWKISFPVIFVAFLFLNLPFWLLSFSIKIIPFIIILGTQCLLLVVYKHKLLGRVLFSLVEFILIGIGFFSLMTKLFLIIFPEPPLHGRGMETFQIFFGLITAIVVAAICLILYFFKLASLWLLRMFVFSRACKCLLVALSLRCIFLEISLKCKGEL